MSPLRRAAFVARRTYRLRRMMDACRMLPVAGLFLIALPLLWGPPGEQGRDLAATGLYLFAVWGALILAAALLARPLARAGEEEGGSAPDR